MCHIEVKQCAMAKDLKEADVLCTEDGNCVAAEHGALCRAAFWSLRLHSGP